MASQANGGASPPLSVPQMDRRKTKSAEMDRSLSHGGDSMDDLRPTTSSSVVSSSTTHSSSRSNGKAKKQAQVQRATVDSEARSSTETLLAGWGDFDSDRLFRVDHLGDQASSELRQHGDQVHVNAHDGRDVDGDIGHEVGMETSKTTHVDQDAQRRSIQQQQRVEELTRRGSKLATQGAPREPPKQVLRQRTLTVMELEAPKPVVDTTPHPNTIISTESSSSILQRGKSFKKSLVSHRRARSNKVLNSSDTTATYLPTIKKGPVAATSMATMPSPRSLHGLLGPQIDDSLDARALVFQRLLPVWKLMSSCRSLAASSSGGSGVSSDTESSTSYGTTSETKSPFECSMVLMKICKTIGISLSSSLAPDVWSSVRKYPGETGRGAAGGGGGGAHVNRPNGGVDFESFSDFVVRNAVQPALHHFRLDRNMEEYLHTLGTVVHSLLVRTTESENGIEGGEKEDGDTQTQSPWRLRELSEIQAVLPHWKKGILAVQKQNPLVKLAHPPSRSYGSPDTTASISFWNHDHNDDDNSGYYQTAIVSADEIAAAACLPSPYTTSTFTSHATTFTTGSTIARLKTLPASEARMQQDANIRRKIQLRQSWQPRLVLASDHHQYGGHHDDRDADLDGRADALGSCMRVEAAVLPVDPTAISNQNTSSCNNQGFFKSEENQEPQDEDDPVKVEPRLLCGACSSEDHEATLWCSACFAVYCDVCWTSTHHSVVDTSLVTRNHERNLPMPSARPLQTTRSSNNHTPPVEMLYLPTKPLAVGKRARGFVSRVQSRATNQQELDSDQSPVSDQDEDDTVSDTEGSVLTQAFSSHAILPSIKPLCQRQRLLKPNKRLAPSSQSSPQLLQPSATIAGASSSMDSTANLLKALMLGTASSASILGSSSCSSTNSTTSTGISISKRVYKDPAKRKKLHPAAVTLDASALLQR